MKKQLLITISFLAFFIVGFAGVTVQKNFLSKEIFGFENGGSDWWLQNSEWSISMDKSAGDGKYCMKYERSSTTQSQLKTHCGSAIELEKGNYMFKMKVWIPTDSEVTGVSFAFKQPWKSLSWSFNGLERGTWVELSETISFDETISSQSFLSVGSANGGKGTFYVDDIAIWGEEAVLPIALSVMSAIETEDNNHINLPAGTYDVSLKVYIEQETTISSFYTQIIEPYSVLEWQIGDVEREKWVELKQEVVFEENLENAPFKIIVNNLPEYGGGTGVFYIDDLTFIDSSNKQTQQIALKKGWNLVSVYIQPESCRDTRPCVSTVFPNAEIVKTFDTFYSSGQLPFLNSLQGIKTGEGYLVYNTIDETIEISGIPAGKGHALSLQKGWNLIGITETTSINDFINSSEALIIKDFDGFYETGGNLNSLTELKKGKAYFMKK